MDQTTAEAVGGFIGGILALGLFWGIPVVFGIRTARRKHRSPHWMWFGVHPIGGFLTWAILATLKPLKACPRCAETARGHARMCAYCGEDFAPTAEVMVTLTETRPAESAGPNARLGRAAVSVIFAAAVLVATPVWASSAQAQSEGQADPSKGSKDVDQVVAHPLARVLEAAKEALATYGCDVKKEKADSLECTRDRHIGVFVGSGGEKVTIKLTPRGDQTRVEVKTGKGFVGRLGKKNWSTPVFNEMLKTLGAP